MKQSFKVLQVWFVCILTAAANAQTISDESRILAECEFIYSYTAQWLQLQNNLGAATSLVRRSTILTTANMMSNAEGGRVPGWKLQMWKDMRPKIKARLDNKKLDPLKEAARCDKEAIPIAVRIRSENLQLWEQDFDSLQNQLMVKMKTTLGL